MKKFLQQIFIYTFIFLIFFEFLSYLATKNNILFYNEIPSYTFKPDNGINWLTEKDKWGAWHKKNYKDRHIKKCSDGTILFDVTYMSNNIGARDDKIYLENTRNKNNIIFIGDSMAEGYGVDFKNTFKEILENNNKDINILNFSTSGNFGPAQYFLIYENLAKKFAHDKVVIFLTTRNDYRDNSISRMKSYPQRYRPYIQKNNSGYELIYPIDSFKKENFNTVSKNIAYNFSINFLINFTYSANTIKTLRLIFNQEKAQNPIVNKNIDIINRGYFAKNIEDINGALYFIEKIFQVAENKKKFIVLIPDKDDLNKINQGHDYENYYWYEKLKKISRLNEAEIIDLAPILSNYDNNEIYFKCDPHLSPTGNKIIANILLNKIF